jgi:hypothetical protein
MSSGERYTLPNGLSVTVGVATNLVRYVSNDLGLIPIDTVALPELTRAPTVVVSTNFDQTAIVPYAGPIPYSDAADLTLGPQGNVWIKEGNGRYAIRRQRIDGDTLLIIRRAVRPISLPDSTLDRIRQMLAGGTVFGPWNSPEAFPPVHSLYPGIDGTLWVRRQTGIESYSFDVFNQDGIFLGTPSLDVEPHEEGFRLRVVTTDALYGISRDTFGVDYVVRFRVDKPEF